jgi:hypothetical protein
MALMVALLVTVASAQSGSAEKATLAGSWVIYVTPAPEGDIPPFVILRAFTKDGGMINSSPTNGAAVGEWIKTGPRQFASTFMGFTKVGEDFLLLKVRESVEINERGDTFAGPDQIDIFDSEENVVITGNGTARGTRFGVEPLE